MTGATGNCRVKKNNDAFVDNTDGYADADEKGEESEREEVLSL